MRWPAFAGGASQLGCLPGMAKHNRPPVAASDRPDTMTLGHTPDDAPVRLRRVYYLSGFDTRSARFYHQLYKTEAERQQAVNGCEYEVGDQQRDGDHAASWTIHAHAAQGKVETRYTFLQWNDIVREHWPASSMRVAASIPMFYWRFAHSGTVGAIRRLSRGFFWMLMLPLLFAATCLLATGVAASATAWFTARLTSDGLAGTLVVAAAAILVAAGLWSASLIALEKSRVFWLMRAWVFMLRWGRQDDAQLRQRWDHFAQRIQADLEKEQADEVLIIGHSAGAMVAIAVAERWLALPGDRRPRPDKVKLVTLGAATPFICLIPEAGWFRHQLAVVGASSMPWMEFTTPWDPLCFALVNPFAACGLAGPTRSNFRIKSARFDKMFDPAEFALLRKDYFRIHFQYLMATRHQVDNDYFHLTAGPHPLPVETTA
jgi:hypothetical protein